MALRTRSRSVVGGTSTRAMPSNVTRPTLIVSGQLVEELDGRLLGRREAVGRDVVGLHRQRRVDGEHDRRPLPRAPRPRSPAGRSRRRATTMASDEQAGGRRGAASPGASGATVSSSVDVGEAHGVPAPAQLQDDVDRGERGDGDEQPQPVGGRGSSCHRIVLGSDLDAAAADGDEADEVDRASRGRCAARGGRRRPPRIAAAISRAAGRRRPRRSGRGARASLVWTSRQRPVSGSTSGEQADVGQLELARVDDLDGAARRGGRPSRRSGSSQSVARRGSRRRPRPGPPAAERRPAGRGRRRGRWRRRRRRAARSRIRCRSAMQVVAARTAPASAGRGRRRRARRRRGGCRPGR